MKSERHRARLSGLIVVFGGILISLNVCVLVAVFNAPTLRINEDEDQLFRVRRSIPNYEDWETLLGFEPRARRLLANTESWNSSFSPSLESDEYSCDDFPDISSKEFLASGWTKAVYRAKLQDGRNVAIKTVNLDGNDVGQCVQKGENLWKECYRKAASKIVKEIVLLKQLVHSNIVKILGYCVSSDVSGRTPVAMVTELGESLDVIKLLRMSWEDRLRVTLGLARLVAHLATGSELGSLAMNDFRRQQFILAADGEVKLTDLDDVGLHEPSCLEHCRLQITSNRTLDLPCENGQCVGYNERLNLLNVGRQFVSLLLPHGAPKQLKALVDDIIDGYSDVRWSANKFLKKFENLSNLYISGKYLNRSGEVEKGVYRKLADSDMPGLHDYRCYHSLSGNGCTFSVYDVTDARTTCSSDPDCRGFVLTTQRTWTGRYLVHFKNNVTGPITGSENTTLYVRVT